MLLSYSNNGSFVANLGNLCSREPWGQSRHSSAQKIESLNVLWGINFDIIRADFDLFKVELINVFSLFQIWKTNFYCSIETTRSDQSWVEQFCSVSSSQNDDILSALKSIHFDQELVQCLIRLQIAVHGLASFLSNGIDFVNENDRGFFLLSLLENPSYSLGSDSDEHFDKFRAAGKEERNSGLTSYGLGQ